MRSFRTLIPLSVILALGVGVACKKPAPAPVEPVKPAEVVAPAAPATTVTTTDDDAARRKAEADAEAARKAAAAAELARAQAFKNAAEAALKDINFDFDKSDIREMDKAKLKRAQCLQKMGLKPAAIKAFKEITDGFRGTPEARTAQQELADLGF